MNSYKFITNNSLEIYINLDNDFAVVNPLNSKRDGLVIDNFSKNFYFDKVNNTLEAFTPLKETLKNETFDLVLNKYELKQTVVNEQLETIKKLHKALIKEGYGKLELFNKY